MVKSSTVMVMLALTLGCASTQKQAEQTSTPGVENTEEDLAFASPLQAAQHFIKPIYSQLDCEGIGEIDDGEVDEHMNGLYFYVDRDQNREISEQELVRSAFNSTPAKEQYLYKLMDVDQSGAVTGYEFRNFIIWAIQTADQNQDGIVTPEEAGIDNMAYSHPNK